ncbi:cell adhesion molecule CEACAM3 isoform X1 [Centroberyx affinis]|uniref:cell adhesion molecule CEACAM3 isoform X1 n=1 Tax=Centroberyx affinis TaxID=166261 RepID=UPI003A5C62BA
MDLLNMKSLLFLLSLIGCCAGQDALPEGPVDAVLGRHVTFKTQINLKEPFVAVVWSFYDRTELVPIVTVTSAGDKVADDYKGRVSVNRTNGFLTLGPLEAKDSGDYSFVVVTASEGTKTGETKLRVLECCVLPEGPVDAVLGKTVTFHTLVEPKDEFIAIIWSFNDGTELIPIVTVTQAGEKVAEDYQGRVSVNRTNGFLTLGPLEEKDSGDYSVNMVTTAGVTKTGETKLRVQGCSVGQNILPEGPVDAVLGKTVTFQTLFDPKEPYIAIFWSFTDGTELVHIATLTTAGEERVADDYQGRVSVNRITGSLTLGPLEEKDNGNYSISVVTPNKGTKTGETKLRVQGCSVGQNILPEGPVDAVLGKTVTFQTLIDPKEPYIAIIWSFTDGTELVHIATLTTAGEERVADDYQGRVSVNRITGSLTLGPLEEKDNGNYSISVVTPNKGTKTGETKLRVQGCCVGQDVLPEGPVDAVLGKTVTFQTLIDPKEPYIAIIWSFTDGTELVHIATVTTAGEERVADDYQGRVSVNRITGSLTLGPLEEKDNGDYSVSLVTAREGTMTGETKLRVLEPVSNLVIKSNVTEPIKLNSTVVLTCSAKGSFLKFSWTNGTAPIVADGKRLTLTEKAKSSTLIITGVLRSDLVSPIYCTAANKLEMEKSAPFNLSVSFLPCPASCQQSRPDDFQMMTLQKLNTILDNQQKIIHMLNSTSLQGDGGQQVLEGLRLRLPCTSEEQLQQLDDQLQDKAYFKQVLNFLSLVGGQTASENVRRTMMAVATNQAWSGFSLDGKRKKGVSTLIKRAVKASFPGTVDEDVEMQIMEVLKNVPGRDRREVAAAGAAEPEVV